ncbi:MAG: ABC transporter substrate-binding protein [Candidatus Omnitrophica bacterium]|nr:ABC transporter substrate-binding protein [Candidatus Omnitrophota bacterium]
MTRRYQAFWIAALLLAGCGRAKSEGQVRVGYMPNITHAQALVGLADGTFQRWLGPGLTIKRYEFNAGPSIIEALFAGELDLAYIGPNPAINGYVKSKGEALRVVAGSASGGAALVVRADAAIASPADFAGKRLASPQLGNTQDVALRHWLRAHELKLRDQGGDAQVIPMQNADILSAFKRKEIDGAWAPEPWATRLIHEADGRLFLDERALWPRGQFVTTLLIARRAFLQRHPELVERWLAAHLDVTAWISGHPAEAKARVNQELERLTGKRLPETVLDEAWGRLEVTYDPLASAMLDASEHAFALGFLGERRPDLSELYDVTLLNHVLGGRRLAPARASKDLNGAPLH